MIGVLAVGCAHDMTRHGAGGLAEPANSSVLAEMVATSSRPALLRSSPACSASNGTGWRPTALVIGLDLPVQDPLDGAPVPAARGRDATAVQPVSDLAQRCTAVPHGQDEGEQVGRPLGRLGRHRGVALGPAAELVGEVGRSLAPRALAALGRWEFIFVSNWARAGDRWSELS